MLAAVAGTASVSGVVLAVMVYTPLWMDAACGFHGRCEAFGRDEAREHIFELAAFFRHQGTLDGRWTAKEIAHLSEVRGFYDVLFLAWPLVVVLMLVTLRRARARAVAVTVAALTLAAAALLPAFGYVWDEVFHALMFDNDWWKNTRADVSWWILPNQFFFATVVAFLLTWSAMAALLWVWGSGEAGLDERG